MYKKYDTLIDDLISKMSLREKVGQLNQVCGPVDEQSFDHIKQLIKKGEVGSIIFYSSWTAGNEQQDSVNVKMYNELQRVAVEESPNHIPIIFGKDVIHGHWTVYPIPLALSASFNPQLVERCYRNIAREASSDSVHWTFSPMVDICRDGRWGRIVEGPGEDPFVASFLAKSAVKGFQGDDLTDNESLVACAKHYIGYGASEGGRDYNRTEISDYSLYNYYLPPFRAAVEAGIGTVMSSFNDINGQPVTSSKKYLTDILRYKLGFEGFVISDYDAVKQLIKQGVAKNRSDCAKMALNAGIDMNMADGCYIENLEMLVNSGEVSEETVNIAVKRILRVKFAKGLFENPYCYKKEMDRTKHLKDARELASESMVLLKNDGILPLGKNTNIAVAGPFKSERRALLGTWTLDGILCETTNFVEALESACSGTIFYNTETAYENFDEISSRAQVIILALGESDKATGEDRSVSDISLSIEQRELIKKAKATGKKVVGVFFCGRPIAMQDVADQLDAVIYAWHSGTETANAVCDIIFGDVNPSGKTTVTFPKKSGHIPLYYNVTSSGRAVNCYYGEKGQQSYIDGSAEPYYPFGYGLSYSKFEYSVPTAEKDTLSIPELKKGEKFKITATVKNMGHYDGKETVQLYINDKIASIMRPLRELKAFKKPFIKSGETAKIDFELGYQEIGFYNENGDYIVESGEVDVFIGENCLTKNKITISIND